MRGDQNLVFLEFPNQVRVAMLIPSREVAFLCEGVSGHATPAIAQDTYNKGRGCSGHPNEAVHRYVTACCICCFLLALQQSNLMYLCLRREMAAILEASLNKELAWA